MVRTDTGPKSSKASKTKVKSWRHPWKRCEHSSSRSAARFMATEVYFDTLDGVLLVAQAVTLAEGPRKLAV